VLSAVTAVLVLAGIGTALRMRLSLVNPIVVVFLAWLPAILLNSVPVTFSVEGYKALNVPPSGYSWMLIGFGFAAFAVGCHFAQYWTVPRLFSPPASIGQEGSDLIRLTFFLVGLVAFAAAYWKSGLLTAWCAPVDEIFHRRLAFHMPHFGHLVLLLDVCALLFVARYVASGRYIFLVPGVVTILLYLLTFQKSRVVFVGLSMGFVVLIKDCVLKERFRWRSVAYLLAALGVVLAAFQLTNAIRGVGQSSASGATFCDRVTHRIDELSGGNDGKFVTPSPSGFTSMSSPFVETLFIYSGAPAIRNFSGTVSGLIKTDAPRYGRIFLRTVLWPFVDREKLNPTRYLGGINNGTALLYYWNDFGLYGAVLFSALAGFAATVAFALARQGTAFGLVAGSVAFYACAISVFTDAFFEPVTAVLLALGFAIFMVERLLPRFLRHK
jgi:hypothetical protein